MSKILILGGTRFLGRALVDAGLAAGHELTLFNRGQTNASLYPGLERLRGDRDGHLKPLIGRGWDAVIDTCGYVPRVVRSSARLLAESVGHYTFISSISVYAEPPIRLMDEQAPLATIDDEGVEEVTGETYGALKALCERAVTEEMGGRALLVRSGLIVGPHDPTDRFTYWPVRVSRGGEILAPASPQVPVQFIDVRDLAHWILHATEQRLTGAFNVTGPAESLTLGELLAESRKVAGTEASLTWVDEEFLMARNVAPFTELPLWLPETVAAFSEVSIAKTLNAGLGFRPLPDTIADTLAWATTRPEDHEWRAGLSSEREAELLAEWHSNKP